MAAIHPLYEAHRGVMEAAMRQRLHLAAGMLRERAMPYVGGSEPQGQFLHASDWFYGHRPRTPTTSSGAGGRAL